MEINTYRLQKDNEEFKDLTYDQLMKIAELCMNYYKKGKFSAMEDVTEDRQDEIDDLENQVSELDEQVNDYIRLTDDYEYLMKDIYKAADNLEEAREYIKDFAETNRLTYRFDWLKNDNNTK